MKIYKSISLLSLLIINIGCSTESYSYLECPKLAHQYSLISSGTMMCNQDENKTVCKPRLYNEFSNRLDVYLTPYFQVMKELDVNKDVSKPDVELYACGVFCQNLRTEIIRLYNPNLGINRYESLKRYSQHLKRNYLNSLGIPLSQKDNNILSNHQPITANLKPISKLTLKDIPTKCKKEYLLYLREEQTQNKNIRLLNQVSEHLDQCIKKENKK